MSLPNCKFNLQLRVSSGQNPDNQKLYVHICIYPKVQNSDITYTQYSNLNNFIIGDDIPKFVKCYPLMKMKNIYKYQMQQVIVLKCRSETYKNLFAILRHKLAETQINHHLTIRNPYSVLT